MARKRISRIQRPSVPRIHRPITSPNIKPLPENPSRNKPPSLLEITVPPPATAPEPDKRYNPGQLSNLRPVTRHITCHHQSGNSTISSSGPSSWTSFLDDSLTMNTIYTTSTTYPLPVGVTECDEHDSLTSHGSFSLINPRATVARMIDFAPQVPGKETLMLKTKSLQYAVVIEGAMDMLLGDGTVTRMRKGDVAVQCGTYHGWRNANLRGWARMFFVLLACEDVLVSSKVLSEDLRAVGKTDAKENDRGVRQGAIQAQDDKAGVEPGPELEITSGEGVLGRGNTDDDLIPEQGITGDEFSYGELSDDHLSNDGGLQALPRHPLSVCEEEISDSTGGRSRRPSRDGDGPNNPAEVRYIEPVLEREISELEGDLGLEITSGEGNLGPGNTDDDDEGVLELENTGDEGVLGREITDDESGNGPGLRALPSHPWVIREEELSDSTGERSRRPSLEEDDWTNHAEVRYMDDEAAEAAEYRSPPTPRDRSRSPFTNRNYQIFTLFPNANHSETFPRSRPTCSSDGAFENPRPAHTTPPPSRPLLSSNGPSDTVYPTPTYPDNRTPKVRPTTPSTPPLRIDFQFLLPRARFHVDRPSAPSQTARYQDTFQRSRLDGSGDMIPSSSHQGPFPDNGSFGSVNELDDYERDDDMHLLSDEDLAYSFQSGDTQQFQADVEDQRAGNEDSGDDNGIAIPEKSSKRFSREGSPQPTSGDDNSIAIPERSSRRLSREGSPQHTSPEKGKGKEPATNEQPPTNIVAQRRQLLEGIVLKANEKRESKAEWVKAHQMFKSQEKSPKSDQRKASQLIASASSIASDGDGGLDDVGVRREGGGGASRAVSDSGGGKSRDSLEYEAIVALVAEREALEALKKKIGWVEDEEVGTSASSAAGAATAAPVVTAATTPTTAPTPAIAATDDNKDLHEPEGIAAIGAAWEASKKASKKKSNGGGGGKDEDGEKEGRTDDGGSREGEGWERWGRDYFREFFVTD